MSRLRRHLMTFLFMLAFAIVLIMFDQGGRAEMPQDWSQRLILPFERWFSQVSQSAGDLVETVRNLNNLKAENEVLRRQIDSLSLVHVQNIELKQENERFRELLDFQESNPNYTLRAAEVIERDEPAKVIGEEVSNFMQAVRIDKGRESGVQPGMSVITPRGLVGQVLESGEGWAKVLLVTDDSSQITAFVQEGRSSGVVVGTGNGLAMRYIPHDQRVEAEDVVLSAGLGGKFPKGLVIGVIESVERHDINTSQEAVVRSTIDFNQLEYVFVIRSFTESKPYQTKGVD